MTKAEANSSLAPAYFMSGNYFTLIFLIVE